MNLFDFIVKFCQLILYIIQYLINWYSRVNKGIKKKNVVYLSIICHVKYILKKKKKNKGPKIKINNLRKSYQIKCYTNVFKQWKGMTTYRKNNWKFRFYYRWCDLFCRPKHFFFLYLHNVCCWCAIKRRYYWCLYLYLIQIQITFCYS